MLRWTFKSLLRSPLGLLGSVLAVAGAFVLVFFFQAVFRGESNKIVAYIENSNADIWVAQRGVRNLHMATSLVWDWKTDRIRAVEGVESATPILAMNTVLNTGNRHWFSYLIGLPPDALQGGPWAMAEGTAVPARGEAVLPAALARLSGIRMGDRITISGLQPRVTGLSRETFSMAASITFLPISDLEEILSTFGAVSYILVKAAPGVDPGDLARRIEKSVEKVSVLTREQFIRSDFELAMQMGVEVIALMTLIGGALAAIIVAFTAYSHTVRQRREIAIIKALGARNSAVYLSIVAQAFGITFAGFVIGFLLIEFLAALIPRLLPLVSLSVAGSDALHTALAAFLVAIAASMLPANTVVRVDPASAFND